MKKLYLLLLLLVLLLNSCLTIKQKIDEYIKNPNYRVIFTTGLTSVNRPENNLNEISISENKIYIYVRWYKIPISKYHYVCKIYDDSGVKINESSMDFSPTSNEWNTWTWYKIKTDVDKSGIWKFEIYLDDKKVIEKELRVIDKEHIWYYI